MYKHFLFAQIIFKDLKAEKLVDLLDEITSEMMLGAVQVRIPDPSVVSLEGWPARASKQ